MQNVRQFSLFSTPSLQMSDKPFSPFAFCFPPYLYMGRYAPKEGKIKEKVTKYFSETLFCVVQLAKWCFFVFFFLTYARACAPSNSDVDFLLSQVSHKGKFWGKNQTISGGRKTDKNDFWLTLSVCFPPLNPAFVKICRKKHRRNLIYSVLQIVLWHLWQQKCKNSCDARIRVRAREGVIDILQFEYAVLDFCFADRCFRALYLSLKTTRRFH